jgi:hypothetical protein
MQRHTAERIRERPAAEYDVLVSPSQVRKVRVSVRAELAAGVVSLLFVPQTGPPTAAVVCPVRPDRVSLDRRCCGSGRVRPAPASGST